MKGKARGIYEYRINRKLVSTGTLHEIAKENGITYNALMSKVYRTKVGINTRTKHTVKMISDSVNSYVIIIGDKFIGEGTLKELSKECNYSREYLNRIANGTYYKEEGKESKIKIYKRVG